MFHLRYLLLIVTALCALGPGLAFPAPDKIRPAVEDHLTPAGPGAVHLDGFLGEKINLCIRNRVLVQDWEQLVEPFRHRDETRLWQSEFWGKWFTSLAMARRYTGDSRMLPRMESAAAGLIATQTPDGYIGNYAPQARLAEWDIWGRKYCLLGLIAHFDATGGREALLAATRLAGHLIAELDASGKSIERTGNYRGMASGSVLEPVVQLYTRTGDRKYLEFAERIVAGWESPDGPGLISKALEGIPVAERFPRPESWWSWENGAKAYEMMSCYEGLLELYRVTGRKEYFQAAVNTWESIAGSEINLAGGAAHKECWYGGHQLQTIPAVHMMETCVTVTWIKFCYQLLRFTGEPRYADALETALYNALLGAMNADGSDFVKYNTLAGRRSLGDNQCGMSLHCCNANGPRGLLTAPLAAVMGSGDGPVVNLYAAGEAEIELPSGNRVKIIQQTDYPAGGQVMLRVIPQRPENFTLALRIPAWSERTLLKDGQGNELPVSPGTFARIAREWRDGDSVVLTLDMRGRVIADPGGGVQRAVCRGPLVLARDSRLDSEDVDTEIQRIPNDRGFVELKPVAEHPEEFWQVYELAVVGDPLGRDRGEEYAVRLCDFLSAGNSLKKQDRYRVWLPLLLDVSGE